MYNTYLDITKLTFLNIMKKFISKESDILSMYEYIFFSNIVFKYITITPEELTQNIENNFLENC